jgi:splicing factor 3B subunit 4
MNRNDRATVYIGALSADVDEDLLFELAVQFGPVRRLVMPKDKLTGVREDFAFVEFANQADAEYMAAVAAVSPIELFGKKIRVSYKGDDQLAADALLEIGAKLCVRNVDPAVDESAVAEHFKQFGNFAVPPKLLRNDHGLSRGIAFISYDSFESSDAALSATNNSWLFNRVITVAYAEKPDGSGQHGSDEERALYRDTKAQLTGEGETAGNAPNAADAAAIASVAAATGTGGPSWAQGLNPYAR